jgi:hypothetical protein
MIKTYKVGLRVPESLSDPFTKIVREIEVIQFLLNHETKYKKQNLPLSFRGFKFVKNLENASESKISGYKTLFNDLRELNRRTLQEKLRSHREKLASYKEKRYLEDGTCEKIPVFEHEDCPSLQEISLGEYSLIAGKSVQLMCQHLRTFAGNHVKKIPVEFDEMIEKAHCIAQAKGSKMTKEAFSRRPEVALRHLTNSSSNLDQIAQKQLASLLDAHRTMRDKVSDVKDLLWGDDFPSVNTLLLSSYSVPYHLKTYMASKWNVNQNWVRNTIVGWRRKMDGSLPEQFQMESLSEFFSKLAEYCHSVAGDCSRVINLLQKWHVLHLLPIPEIDLSPLFSRECRSEYLLLKSTVRSWPKELDELIRQKTSDINLMLCPALSSEIDRINSVIEEGGFSEAKRSRIITFRNKLLDLDHEQASLIPLFRACIPGNRFINSISRLSSFNTDLNVRRVKDYYTAFRGVMTSALALTHPDAIVQMESLFTPENCLTKPLCSPNNKNTYLPLDLVSPKYIVQRKIHPLDEKNVNSEETTDMFRVGKPIWLGINIYLPRQLNSSGLLQGSRKGVFWFQLLPSKKIIECIVNGARVKDIRINIPRGAVHKLVADIVLSGDDRTAFRHRGAFIKEWHSKHENKPFPRDSFLGSDINTVGKYILAISTPKHEIDLSEMGDFMGYFERCKQKLDVITKKLIPTLQNRIDTKQGRDGNPLNNKKIYELKGQLSLLHHRKKNLRTSYKREMLMLYMYCMFRVKCEHASWDAIEGITTRGTRGTLATAITNMPKHERLYNELKEWARDLKDMGILEHFIDVIPVTPYTSKTCASCLHSTGKENKSLKCTSSYHVMKCSACGQVIIRHVNSSRVSAINLRSTILNAFDMISPRSPFPLSTDS